jgi:trehalose/maltose transport system permease protein
MATPVTTAPDRPSGAAPPGAERARSRELSESALGKLFIAPSLIAMALVALFPILYALFLSLFAYTGRQREGFAGLSNYAEQLTDPRFWEAVRVTFTFTVASVALEFLIGLGFALLMNQAFVGRGVTRATILIPWVIPTVISAQIWFFMLNITPGFVNTILGIGDFNWLGQRPWALVSLVMADVWKTAPFVALLLLAGLQTIPEDMYEAARVDGASTWQRFRSITLPLLRPAIFVALLFRTVDSLRIFDLPKVMTNGANGTETLSILVQTFIVGQPNPGVGSTLATLTFIVVLGVGVIFISLIGRNLVIGE